MGGCSAATPPALAVQPPPCKETPLPSPPNFPPAIEAYLHTLAPIPLVDAATAAALPPANELTYRAGTLVVNPAGLDRQRPKQAL